MKFDLKILEWDSSFFDYKVSKLFGRIETKEDIVQLESAILEEQIKLTYFSSPFELPSFISDCEKIELKLVDRKTTYLKATNPGLRIHESTSSVDENGPLDKLEELAIQSGIYSRFNVDDRIGEANFERMYRLWMLNSLKRDLAQEVFIFSKDDEIAGMVTMGAKNNRADIGLIAVDEKFRGQGIGRLLMQSAEKWFHDQKYDFVQVVTQGDNKAACRLYKSCGYVRERVEYFYHIWIH